MRDNLQLSQDTLRGAQGITIGGLSGLITGVASGGDLYAVRNISARRIAIPGLRLRWAPRTAFTTAQGIALTVQKVYGFTAIHTTGGTAIQAHHRSDLIGGGIGDRIPLSEISAYIAATGAITGATYTAPDADEPEVFAVGAGGTLPGVYEDYSPSDGLPWVLPADTGLVVKLVGSMGAAGVGMLYVAPDAFRLD